MNVKPFDQDGELVSNFLIAVLSLTLVAGYACLFHLFQSDRQESRAVVTEQSTVATVSDSLSFQESE